MTGRVDPALDVARNARPEAQAAESVPRASSTPAHKSAAAPDRAAPTKNADAGQTTFIE
jgi:hypothetical protein